MSKVYDVMHAFFKERSKTDIKNDENLFKSGLLDSMGVIELINYLEETIGVTIEPEEITEDNFESIDAIVNLVGTKK